MAGETLQDIGYRVVIAHSAEEALKRFDEAYASGDAFKLVFSDVIMPGGANGLVLAEQIASRDPAVPILLTTGYNDEMARQTPEDLRRYAAAYISGRPRVTGVLLSAADRRALNLTEAELAGMWRRVAAAQAARAAAAAATPAAPSTAPARRGAARNGARRP